MWDAFECVHLCLKWNKTRVSPNWKFACCIRIRKCIHQCTLLMFITHWEGGGFYIFLDFLGNIFLYYCNLKYRITIDKRYFVIWWILVLFEIQSMSIITNVHIAVGMYFKWWREREIQTIRSISHEKNLISLIVNENCFAFNFLFSGRISYYLRDSV